MVANWLEQVGHGSDRIIEDDRGYVCTCVLCNCICMWVSIVTMAKNLSQFGCANDFEAVVVLPTENLLAFSKGRTLNNSDGRFDDCLAEKEVGSVIDSGVMPGDGMGGGGTDSTFFS